MKADVKNLLADYEKYHSSYQMENFIIGSQGNAWGQYKQCLREIKSRSQNIEEMKDERKLLELDIADLRIKRFFCFRRSTRIRNAIRLNSLRRKLLDLEESLSHTLRELIFFVDSAKRIKSESWGNKPITGDMRKSLEAQMWFERITQMMAVDMLAFGRVSKNTFDMIFNMPKTDRKELLAMIEPANIENLIGWTNK
jgi:hypothetical protein